MVGQRRLAGRGPLTNVSDSWLKDADQRGRVLEWMQRRLLALGVVSGPHDARESATLVIATGIVLKANGRLFWITAGHVLEQLERLRRDSTSRIWTARWYDLHPNRPAAHLYAELQDLRLEFGTGDQPDVGIAHLPPALQDLLRANPVLEPFTLADIAAVTSDHPTECSVVVGYPHQWLSQTPRQYGRGAGIEFVSAPVAIPIQSVIDPTTRRGENTFWSRDDCFYAKVSLDSSDGEAPLQTILGVSGGPAITVIRRPDGALVDCLVGIQSAWLPQQRIVRIEDIRWITRFLEHLHKQEVRNSAAR